MGSMAICPYHRHDGSPECAVTTVVVRFTSIVCDEILAKAFHPGFDNRKNLMMNRDDADAGSCLAMSNLKIALA